MHRKSDKDLITIVHHDSKSTQLPRQLSSTILKFSFLLFDFREVSHSCNFSTFPSMMWPIIGLNLEQNGLCFLAFPYRSQIKPENNQQRKGGRMTDWYFLCLDERRSTKGILFCISRVSVCLLLVSSNMRYVKSCMHSKYRRRELSQCANQHDRYLSPS